MAAASLADSAWVPVGTLGDVALVGLLSGLAARRRRGLAATRDDHDRSLPLAQSALFVGVPYDYGLRCNLVVGTQGLEPWRRCPQRHSLAARSVFAY